MTFLYSRAAIVGIFAALVPCLCGASESPWDPARIETPLMSARLAIVGNQAIASYRFKKPSAVKLTELVATIDGRLVKEMKLEQYPQAGQTDAVLLLTDVSGPSRAAQITDAKRNMLIAATKARPHQQIVIGIYGQEAAMIVPSSNDRKDFARVLAGLQPVDEPANPLGVAARAIRTLEKSNSERKAIFLFSDGAILAGGLQPAEVERLALEKRVIINVIFSPSDRQANPDVLRQFAVGTGGVFVDPANTGAFLKRPFDLLDSGGRIKVSLAGARRMVWESQAVLDITFTIGDDHIRLSRNIGLPVASIADHFVQAPIISGSLALLGLGVPLGGVAWLLRRRRPASATDGQVVYAILKNMQTGQIYSIQKPVIQIGRSDDNDIVVQDDSVSRYQAILEQGASGEVTIKNLAPNNPLKINGIPADKKNLFDGDVVETGGTQLRYSRVSRGETSVS